MPGDPYRWERLAAGRYVAVDGGSGYGCALADDGIPWCWWTEYIPRSSSRPFHIGAVPGAPSLVQLQTGSMFACGLTANGAAFCWNFGPERTATSGQLGDGTQEASATPVRAATDVPFTSLAVGAEHACGLSSAGETWCWGSNTGNALGIPRDSSRSGCVIGSALSATTHWCTVPQRVETDLRFRAISAATERTCALTADGKAYCWGANDGWTLGAVSVGEARCKVHGPLGDAIACTPSPVAVTGDIRFATLRKSTGGYHQCGATMDGRTYCWGTVENDGRPAPALFGAPGVPVQGSAEPRLLVASGP